MNRVLSKRLLRDLKANIARYIALMLMIAVGMFIVTSLVGSAETVIRGTQSFAEEDLIEDGQFGVFVPLTEAQEKELTDTGIALERMFSADLKLSDGSSLRMMKVRKCINRICLDEGVLPSEDGEAVLEKRYCEEHGYSLGDVIETGGSKLTITGMGSVPDYDLPVARYSDSAAESSLFGLVFVTDHQYEVIMDNTDVVEDYCYAYRLNGKLDHDELKSKIEDLEFDYTDVDDEYFREMTDAAMGKKEEVRSSLGDLSDGADKLTNALESSGITEGEIHDAAKGLSVGAGQLEDQAGEFLDAVLVFEINNLTTFREAEDNPRILAASKDMLMNRNVGLMAGVIVLVMFAYVISVFVVHQIQQESSVIGTLYALGAKRNEILRHYITLPAVISFFGGAVGLAASVCRFGMRLQMSSTYSYYSIPDLEPEMPLYLLLYSVILPPLISAAVNCIVISRKLSGTALSMIRNEQNVPRYSKLKLDKLSFVRCFQVRQMLREARTGITVILGMFVCMMVFMMGMDCYVLCDNIRIRYPEDTRYEYMYDLKYPPDTVPENAEACYVESLSKYSMGNTLDVSVIGIDNDNKYYPVKAVKGKSSIIASSAVAQRYHLSVGDDLILDSKSGSMSYVFKVEGIADYSVGLTVFMDIDSMRELFGRENDYYNVLLSDTELDIESGRIYSVTTGSDIERSAQVFVDLMKEMFTILISASLLIFCVVLYLMMKVMIDRSSFGISLVRVFGYRTKEIRKLYLDGNILTVTAGALISVPLAKKLVDLMFPAVTANVACGLELTFPWYLYVVIFAGIMLLYIIINRVLAGRIRKITPAEVLKRRE